jgi:hypothetical protein
MYIYFDKILQYFLRYRKSLALSYFFFGAPITYFLREYVGLAPGSQAFTGALTFGALILAMPLFMPEKLFMPHLKGTLILGTYWFFTFLYMLLYSPHQGGFTSKNVEIIYFMVTLSIFLICLSISVNELKDNFLEVTLVLCVLGCLCLLFVVISDPTTLLSGRASITLSSSDGDENRKGSNPHIYAKSAYAGLVCIALIAKNYKSLLAKIFFLGLGTCFIIVLGLTQSMQTFVALVIFLALFFILRLKPVNIYHATRWIFGYKGILLGLLVYFSLSYVMEHTKYGNMIESATTYALSRAERIYVSVSGQKTTKLDEIDYSAKGRMETISIAYDIFEKNLQKGYWLKIIFGNGYQHFYIDSPFIEAFNDLGIVGFLIFLTLHLVIISIMVREFLNPTTNFNSFLCYVMILTIVIQFVAGMPYDYTRYSMMAVLVRFCVPYSVRYVSPKLKPTT